MPLKIIKLPFSIKKNGEIHRRYTSRSRMRVLLCLPRSAGFDDGKWDRLLLEMAFDFENRLFQMVVQALVVVALLFDVFFSTVSLSLSFVFEDCCVVSDNGSPERPVYFNGFSAVVADVTFISILFLELPFYWPPLYFDFLSFGIKRFDFGSLLSFIRTKCALHHVLWWCLQCW